MVHDDLDRMGLKVEVDRMTGKLEVAQAAMQRRREKKDRENTPREMQQGDILDEKAVERGRLRLERLAEDFM